MVTVTWTRIRVYSNTLSVTLLAVIVAFLLGAMGPGTAQALHVCPTPAQKNGKKGALHWRRGTSWCRSGTNMRSAVTPGVCTGRLKQRTSCSCHTSTSSHLDPYGGFPSIPDRLYLQGSAVSTSYHLPGAFH